MKVSNELNVLVESIVASICIVAKNDIPRAVKSKNTKYVLNCSDARI